MKWLEELIDAIKKLPEATWVSTPDIEKLECVILAYIPRLIAIAEGAESHKSCDEGLYHCPICKTLLVYPPQKHQSDCPYSEDWKPKLVLNKAWIGPCESIDPEKLIKR